MPFSPQCAETWYPAGEKCERVRRRDLCFPGCAALPVPPGSIRTRARQTRIPARETLRDWTRRMAGPAPLVYRIAPETPRAASLPFIGIVEAHMLRGFKELGLTPNELPAAVARLRHDTGDECALARAKRSRC